MSTGLAIQKLAYLWALCLCWLRGYKYCLFVGRPTLKQQYISWHTNKLLHDFVLCMLYNILHKKTRLTHNKATKWNSYFLRWQKSFRYEDILQFLTFWCINWSQRRSWKSAIQSKPFHGRFQSTNAERFRYLSLQKHKLKKIIKRNNLY